MYQRPFFLVVLLGAALFPVAALLAEGSESGWRKTAELPAPEAFQAAAADERFVYAIANRIVARYDRETGERVDQSRGPAEHLNSGFLWDGAIYCAHSNYPQTPPTSQILRLDLETMALEPFQDFDESPFGSLTWVVREGEYWWCNFAQYGEANIGTTLVKFDADWHAEATWTYPPEVLAKLGRYSISGGLWRDGELLVTGHDEPELYRLLLPERGEILEYLGTVPAPFTGQGIAADPKMGGLVGIDRPRRRIVFAALEKPTATAHDIPTRLQRIAFGSCARQNQPQPIWEAVVADEPELFLFLGDNIYADTEDMDVMRAKYEQLGKIPGFQRLRETCPILATWDDHDYGANDAGAEYPLKRESQQVFLDFFGIPEDSPRRQREGVYHAQRFGPEGHRVQVILLDGRYFRSPLKRGYEPGEPGEGYRGRYAPNSGPDATMLGETQWAWLEEQLREPAEVRILCSGVQVIADEHGSETWGNFPLERQRLFDLIRDTEAEGVFFLSGDRHLAEISRLDASAEGVGYPLYDVTSSSLNAPSGNFTKAGTRFANEINSYRVGLTYFDTNFGVITIDWEPADPVLRLQVRDQAGDVVLQQRLRLSELGRTTKTN